MKKVQRSSFKLNPIAASIVLAMASQLSATVANAGSGFGAGFDLSNAPVAIPTYYANSPVGPVPSIKAGVPQINTTTKLPIKVDSGTALRKFVDTLPGFGAAAANNLGQYIPVAVPEAWKDGNGVTTPDDYYEIAAVEYSEKMHSDLAKATHLRGYVQLVTPGLVAKGVTGVSFTTLDGRVLNVVDKPHHLGPVINASSGKAVRIKFTNYLPTGASGNLFLPVDTTITGAGLGPDGITSYTQNRAEIHLIGAQAPWISAGSPHQWVAPAGETAAYTKGLGKGASTQNVPDMPDPGPGAVTLYFPNNQSARFTFYQDRTSGLTRLNAYAGLEAGYKITDPIEQGLIISATNPNGVIPADEIPLIIEDKTFVPKNVAQQDAKWTWGAEGDLWFPHVYETNQDPSTIDGANPVGRWDYGPWFWPIFNASSGNLPAVSFTPEAFHDTPVINGTAYPTLTVDPKAYRFRILNASNDRFVNLGLYKADTTVSAPQLDLNGNPVFSASGVQQFFTGTEVKMVPAVADVNGNPLASPAPQFPNLAPVQSLAPAWPVDNRIGGAPDPTTAGPDFVVIGNDGGLLPNPVDVSAQPITYESNRRSITVGNIFNYGLLLAPAERSDAIVDFSQYAGQTLILYNDAPTPVPFIDSRVDYFTGDPDQTTTGGAYSTKPGYGPNTRTMMQIKVTGTANGTAFNADALNTALPVAYAQSQASPIVPESAYNAAFGTTDGDTWAHVASGSFAQPNLDFSYTPQPGSVVDITGLKLISSGGTGSGSGMGYLANPNVVFNFPAAAIINPATGTPCKVTPVATAIADPVTAQVKSVTLTTNGLGCTAIPIVTFVNTNGGVGAQATLVTTATASTPQTLSVPVLTKAEQELFDTYGRYNSTGGVELPYTTAITQTTVPLNYIDAATEIIGDGEIQLWKFVDNGLFTNALRFDFVDVQLVNRVGWDGTVKPPAANEVGWKDTVRLNPLEDVIVAMRAKRPATPFGLPQSVRSMDPAVAAGASGSNMGFTVDPGVTSTAATGGTTPSTPLVPALTPLLTTAVNVAGVNYDNEYTWNSSVLSHSENDLTRPVVFNPTVTKPTAPSGLTQATAGNLSWVDPTPYATAATGSINSILATNDPTNEIGFQVKRAEYAINNSGQYVPGTYIAIGTTLANATGFIDTTQVSTVDYAYKVAAWNAAGSTDSAPVLLNPSVIVPPAAPTNLVVTISASGGTPALLSWTDNATNETSYTVQRVSVTPLGGSCPTTWPTTGVVAFLLAANASAYPDSTTGANALNTAKSYCYRVGATNKYGTQWVQTSKGIAFAPPVLANSTTVKTSQNTLTWNAVTGVTNYVVKGSVNGAASTTLYTGSNLSYTTSAMALGKIYTYQVVAQTTSVSNPSNTITVAPLSQSTNLVAARGNLARTITVNWKNATTNVSSFTIQRKAGNGAWATINPTWTLNANTGVYSFTDTGLIRGTSYTYQILTTSQFGKTAYVSTNAVTAQ